MKLIMRLVLIAHIIYFITNFINITNRSFRMLENSALSKNQVIIANSSTKEILEMEKQLNTLTVQNYKTLKKIEEIAPDFEYELYESKKFAGKHHTFKRQLLLKQIDKLLEEKSFLDRKLHTLTIQFQQNSIIKDDYVLKESIQYSFLRSIWSKFQQAKGNSSFDRIQQLNKAVCILKNNIIGVTNRQKLMPSIPQQNQLLSSDHQKLKLKFQRLNMKYEDLLYELERRQKIIQQFKFSSTILYKQISNLKASQKKHQSQIIKFKINIAKKQQTILNLNGNISSLEKQLLKVDKKDNQMNNIESNDKKFNQLTYNNSQDKFKIKLFIDNTVQLNSLKQHSTQKKLNQIVVFLNENNQKRTDIIQQTDHVPSLILPTKLLSCKEQLSERTHNQKFISQRDNIHLCTIKSQRKLLSSRNQVTAKQSKKFVRTSTIIDKDSDTMNNQDQIVSKFDVNGVLTAQQLETININHTIQINQQN